MAVLRPAEEPDLVVARASVASEVDRTETAVERHIGTVEERRTATAEALHIENEVAAVAVELHTDSEQSVSLQEDRTLH